MTVPSGTRRTAAQIPRRPSRLRDHGQRSPCDEPRGAGRRRRAARRSNEARRVRIGEGRSPRRPPRLTRRRCPWSGNEVPSLLVGPVIAWIDSRRPRLRQRLAGPIRVRRQGCTFAQGPAQDGPQSYVHVTQHRRQRPPRAAGLQLGKFLQVTPAVRQFRPSRGARPCRGGTARRRALHPLDGDSAALHPADPGDYVDPEHGRP